MPEIIEVHVEQDHLQRLIHSSQPLKAVAELIWNALDADATSVVVKVVESELGGVQALHVEDDGLGMTPMEAKEEFSHLGGSWKRYTERSKSLNRVLHGREGQGRWRAYAIGERVRWISVAQDEESGETTRVTIEGRRSNLGRFSISDPESVDASTGTLVIVDEVSEGPEGLLGDMAVAKLTAEFATYLEQYPVDVVYRGSTLDPAALQQHREQYEIEVDGVEPGAASLTVIEWSEDVDRALYLCDEHGPALERLLARVHAPGFDFTGYLRWGGFREREGELALAELGAPVLGELVEAARDRLREHFRARTGERTKALIQEWKEEEVYPYDSEPSTAVEAAEQDLFDVVALAAAPAVNRSGDRVSKRLTLGLIKEALEQSPGSLRRVFEQVLDLSEEKLEELDVLLRRTPLTAVITAAKKVADRLEFVKGLEVLLFKPESTATLLERSQLHRILAGETWIFGEEFNLMGDDSSLTTVLKAHLSELGREELAVNEPVRDELGKIRVVDLALGRALRLNQNRREHLVVELKRPNVTLGRKEVTQIEGYAVAVASDSRFSRTEVQWDFVLVGNDWDEFAELRAKQKEKPPGLILDSEGLRVWVKTWSQLLAENKHRLKFVQDSLEYMPDEDQALEYLRQTHMKYLPDVLADVDESEGVAS